MYPEPLKIVNCPHPVLAQKSEPVTKINNTLRKLASQMFALMYEQGGVGLAANQVAVPLRLFVVNPTGKEIYKDQELVFINPEIVYFKKKSLLEEGCLSAPGITGLVQRSEEIIVTAFNLQGEEFKLRLSGLLARVVQHEYDHIEGKMFFDRVVKSKKKTKNTGNHYATR